jgi:hypothetical protein
MYVAPAIALTIKTAIIATTTIAILGIRDDFEPEAPKLAGGNGSEGVAPGEIVAAGCAAATGCAVAVARAGLVDGGVPSAPPAAALLAMTRAATAAAPPTRAPHFVQKAFPSVSADPHWLQRSAIDSSQSFSAMQRPIAFWSSPFRNA